MNLAAGMVLGHAGVAALSTENRNTVIADFAKARNHLTYTCTIKLANWLSFPLLLAGLAHHKPVVAASVAVRILTLRPVSGLPDDHPTVQALCRQASSLRDQLEQFAAQRTQLQQSTVAVHSGC
jgi:hypothetical protein